MTSMARITAATPLCLVVAMLSLAGMAQAQAPLFEVEKGVATKLLQVTDDAGFLVRGSTSIGSIPATGAGVRLMWYPRDGSVPRGLRECRAAGRDCRAPAPAGGPGGLRERLWRWSRAPGGTGTTEFHIRRPGTMTITASGRQIDGRACGADAPATDCAVIPESMRLTYAGHTDTGMIRGRNEDQYFMSADRGLFIVADGMGGHAAGEVASEMAVRVTSRALGALAGLTDAEACERMQDAMRSDT